MILDVSQGKFMTRAGHYNRKQSIQHTEKKKGDHNAV